jgi:uncharacterized protein (TIGR02118 family)
MKLMTFIRRRKGMTVDEFEHHWLHVHGELVKRHMAAVGIKRYVQTHVGYPVVFDLFNSPRGGDESVKDRYDGVAEVWFESQEAFMKAMASDAGKAAMAEIAADEPNFVDYKSTYNFFGDEVLMSSSPDWDSPLDRALRKV